MTLSTNNAIQRFGENEQRVDIFVNDPQDNGYYSTNETIPRQVETLPALMERLQQRYIIGVFKGDWQTTTAYVTNDLVKQSGVVYICIVAHTSGTFATDASAGKWAIFQGAEYNNPYDVSGAYASGTLGATLKALGRDVAQYPYNAELTGLVDVSAKLQQVIDAVSASGGGIIRGPSEAVLLIDAPVKLKDNITLLFYGTKIKVGPNIKGNKGVFQNFTGTFDTPGTITATQNVKIRGLVVDGQNSGIDNALIPNVDMQGAVVCVGGWTDGSGIENLSITDCDMSQFAGAGVMVWKSKDVEIRDNRFKNFFANVGLSIGSPIDCHEVDGLTVSGNRISHSALGKSWHGIVILDWDAGSKNVVVTGNNIRNMNNGDGISCEGNSTNNIDNAVFTGNVIANCAGDGIGVDRCIEAIVSNNVITTNITSGNAGIGIKCDLTETLIAVGNNINGRFIAGIWGSEMLRHTIANNRIQGMVYADVNYQGDGIFMYSSAPSTAHASIIQGNYIKDIDGGAIYTSNTSSEISANVIYNFARNNSPTRKFGINAAGSVRGNTVIGVSAYGEYGIAIQDGVSLADNKVLGTFGGGKYFMGWRNGIYQGDYVNFENLSFNDATKKIEAYNNAAPIASRWVVGDKIWNTAPSAGGSMGWVCTTAGVPGTWKTFGSIAP